MTVELLCVFILVTAFATEYSDLLAFWSMCLVPKSKWQLMRVVGSNKALGHRVSVRLGRMQGKKIECVKYGDVREK